VILGNVCTKCIVLSYIYILSSFRKVFGHFKSFSGRVLYDTLQDSEYRRTWDEAVLHDHTICTIAGVNSDINYYCSKCIVVFMFMKPL
jgi:hypothetical protein